MMKWSVSLVCTLLLIGLLSTQPAQSQSQPRTRAAIDAACRPGSDPKIAGDENYPGGLSPRGSGLTPQKLPGATTISAREAKCIIDRFGAEVIVIAAMDGGEKLPGAYEAGAAASTDQSIQAPFAEGVAKIARGDKTRPIIVYCHHERCFLSYNVALRAVQAGYTNVFWLRPGINGWKAAGYSVQSPPPSPSPAASSVSPQLRAEIARCRKNDLNYSGQDWASMLTQIPTLAEQDKAFIRDRNEKAKWYKLCLSNVARAAIGAADIAEANRAVAAADGEVTAMFNAARREVETNPAKYLSMVWDSHKPAQLRADLAALRAVKTLEQACGAIDFSQPALNRGEENNRYRTSLNQRRMQHGQCITAYSKETRHINKTFGLESANKWVQATRRFTCAATANRLNCIPNEPFNTIAGIATDANIAFAKRQDALFWQQRGRVAGLINQGNAWIAELNRRVDQFNRSY